MAEAKVFAQTPNILGGLGLGANIAGQRQSQALALDRFRAEQQQLALENERRAKQEEEQRKINELDLLERAIQKETNPDAMRSIGNRINRLTTELFPDSPDFDFDRLAGDAETMKQFQRDLVSFERLEQQLGPDDPTVLQISDAMRIKYERIPKALEQIEAVREPTAEEQFKIKEKQAAITSERELGEQEKLTRQTLNIRQEFAREEKKLADAELQAAIDKSDLSKDIKDRLKLGLKLGAGVTEKLLPKAGDDIQFTTIERVDPLTGEPTKIPARMWVDETGQLRYQVAVEAKAEQPRVPTAVAKPVGTKPNSIADVDTSVNMTFDEWKANLESTQGLTDKQLSEFYLEDVASGAAAIPKRRGQTVTQKLKGLKKSTIDFLRNEQTDQIGRELNDYVEEITNTLDKVERSLPKAEKYEPLGIDAEKLGNDIRRAFTNLFKDYLGGKTKTGK